jgi:hypothetical protein
MFYSGEKVTLDQVVGIEHRPLWGREDKFIRDTAFPSAERAKHSAVSKLKQYSPKLSRQIYAA